MTCLQHTVKAGEWNIVRYLVGQGADLNVQDENGHTPLFNVAEACQWDIVELMIKRGAFVDTLTLDQKVCLLQHITNSNLDIVQYSDLQARSILYRTIHLNNAVLLGTLFNKWQCDYSDKPDILQRIDSLLPEVYEELRLKDVPLSVEMQFCVESRVIYSRFFANRSKKLEQQKNSDLDDVIKRIDLLCDHVDKLKRKYSCWREKKVDREFVFIVRCIAQNIRVLKRKLRSTYNKLPWEEMEFCLVNFISVNTKCQEFNVVYKLVLDKERLLNHLTNFARNLKIEKSGIKETDVNSKLPKQHNSYPHRHHHISSSHCSEFFDLYEDYVLIKNVYSLKRIEKYIKLATTINLTQRKMIGQLLIERTLQVLGENFKNTMESPNLSYDVHELLLHSAPKNVRENATSLRDLLSHSHTLSKKVELENSKDQWVFHKIQNDLIKIEVEIGNILYRQKCNAIRMFLTKVINCQDLTEMKELSYGLGNIFTKGEINLRDTSINTNELERFNVLIKELSAKIADQTDKEQALFKNIRELLYLQQTKLKGAKENYIFCLSTIDDLISQIIHSNNSERIKDLSRFCLNGMKSQVKDKKLREIVVLVLEISHSVKQRMKYEESDKIQIYILKILCTIEFEAGTIRGIHEFKERLEKDDNKSQSKSHEEISVIFDDIKKCIKEETVKNALQIKVQNRKIIHETKLALIDFFDKKLGKNCTSCFTDKATYINAIKMLNLNSKNEKRLMSYYENDSDAKKAKAVAQQTIPDSYGKLTSDLGNLQSSFSLETKRKSLETFLNSIELVNQLELKQIVNDTTTYHKKQLQCDFNERVALLEQLLHLHVNFELMDKCTEDKEVRMAVEMLVLDLTEILENTSLLEDDALLFDTRSPVISGKSLRNYLAHGDALIDVLPSNPTVAVIASAIKFVKEGNDLITNDKIVGYHIKENITELNIHFNWSLNLLLNQNEMFSAAKEGNMAKLTFCIGKGADIHGRDTNRMTGLHYAAQGNSLEVVKFFLDRHLSVTDEDNYNHKPHHHACMFGNSEIVQYFIETKIVYVNEIDSEKTMLYVAAEYGQEDVVKVLLDKQANVESPGTDNLRPLHVAAKNGYPKVVEVLLQNGANIDAQAEDNRTPLYFASQNGHIHVVETLLKKQADIYGQSNNMNPLFVAAKNGHAVIVKALLANGINKAMVDKNNWSVLHFAAKNGFIDVIEALLHEDVDVNTLSTHRWSPLHFAAENGHTDVIKALLARNADVNASNVNEVTPLHWAAQNGHLEAVVALLKNGADVNASHSSESSSWTALHFAVLNGHKEVVRALLYNEASVDAQDEHKATPLHLAANQGLTDIIAELLLLGANVNASNENNLTPLYVAAYKGSTNAVIALLDKNASVDVSDKNGSTPLHIAAEMGHEDIVAILLNARAKVGATNYDCMTPLYLAAKSGHIDVVQTLLRNGADVNAVCEGNMTPLLVAAASGQKAVVDGLLRNGANFDDTTHDRNTSLHLAAATGHKAVVDLLLNHFEEKRAISFNQLVNVQNKDHVTPLHVAAQSGHRDVVMALLQRGANVNAKTTSNLTPLYLATFFGYQDVVVSLLENGANIYAPNLLNVTPLHVAAGHNSETLVDLLLTHIIQTEPKRLSEFVNAPAKGNVSPLHMAVAEGHADVVQVLLENGANIYSRTSNGHVMPLHKAAMCGHKPVVDVLLNHVQEHDPTKFCEFVNVVAQDGFTSLHLAAKRGHTEVVVALLNKGANVNVVDENNRTPVFYGAQYGHMDVVNALLAKGADYR